MKRPELSPVTAVAQLVATTREEWLAARINSTISQHEKRIRRAYDDRRPGYGEFLLARLGLALAKLTACEPSLEALGDLIYVEYGNPAQLVDDGGA